MHPRRTGTRTRRRPPAQFLPPGTQALAEEARAASPTGPGPVGPGPLARTSADATPSANLPRRPGPIFHMPHHRTALADYRQDDDTARPHAHYR